MANSFDKLGFSFWKIILVSDKPRYWTEKISKQVLKAWPDFFLKMQEKIEKVKWELLRKKKQIQKDLENSQPIHTSENKKECSGENTKCMAR